jgi:hypothetical protein
LSCFGLVTGTTLQTGPGSASFYLHKRCGLIAKLLQGKEKLVEEIFFLPIVKLLKSGGKKL